MNRVKAFIDVTVENLPTILEVFKALGIKIERSVNSGMTSAPGVVRFMIDCPASMVPAECAFAPLLIEMWFREDNLPVIDMNNGNQIGALKMWLVEKTEIHGPLL